MHVHVDLPGEFDVHGWPDRHARGEVADALPYGLDKMARHGITTTFRRPLTGLPLKVARRVRGRLDHADPVSIGVDALRRDRRRADAILCWNERSGVPSALVPGGAPVAWNPTWLQEPAQVAPGLRRMARRAIPRSAAIFHFNDAVCAAMERNWGIPDGTLHRVRLGVDESYYRPQPYPLDGHTVISVGDDRRRDYGRLVRAVQGVVDSGVPARLEIATVRQRVEVPDHLGVVHRRRMEGLLPDLHARSSVVAIAITADGAGSGLTALLEAMALGRPVVVTGNPGIEEYVEDGVSGLLVPPGDDLALREAISSLLKDPDAAAAMGRAGRLRVERSFTTQHMADDLAGMLRTAV